MEERRVYSRGVPRMTAQTLFLSLSRSLAGVSSVSLSLALALTPTLPITLSGARRTHSHTWRGADRGRGARGAPAAAGGAPRGAPRGAGGGAAAPHGRAGAVPSLPRCSRLSGPLQCAVFELRPRERGPPAAVCWRQSCLCVGVSW